MTNSPLTLREYYRSFGRVSGWLAGLISFVPLVSKPLPESFRAYGFPPLGSLEDTARILAFVFALAATYFAFFSRGSAARSTRKRVTYGFGVALVSLMLYMGLFQCFVRTVEIPSEKTTVQVSVSVGFERTEFAKANFGGDSDLDLLRHRGFNDEEIQRLWTLRSLVISRLGLYFSYLILLLSLVTAFSWGVVYEMQETQGSGREKTVTGNEENEK